MSKTVENAGAANHRMSELPDLQSSFLFAGAGAGKTRAVVMARRRHLSTPGGDRLSKSRRGAYFIDPIAAFVVN